MDENQTPSQRLFKLAGWIIAVPIVLAALVLALVVIGFLARSIFGTAGAWATVVVFALLVGFTVKKVWKG